tara:strand:+ start:705 stop:1784 length:1080 start_codon:yes stop_codon:yes gene_type:complete
LILVIGGAGFIGTNFVFRKLQSTSDKEEIVVMDSLTYSGNLDNFKSIKNNKFFTFIQGDITKEEDIENILKKYRPRSIINFAAETHVDRSITSPDIFIQTNIIGVYNLLKHCLNYYQTLPQESNEKHQPENFVSKKTFRFIQISTDEVYGSLSSSEPSFTEDHPFRPNSPYSASKASGDHLVRSWVKTFGFPAIITNCSNNYGPYQYPEKLIPLVINNCLNGKKIPIYGDGTQIRDWLYVDDHCAAVDRVLKVGEIGQTYNIGGQCECSNIDLVNLVCSTLDDCVEKRGIHANLNFKELITYVKDRPGHDYRYSINAEKIESRLNWRPTVDLKRGIRKTIEWYLQNKDWIENKAPTREK